MHAARFLAPSVALLMLSACVVAVFAMVVGASYGPELYGLIKLGQQMANTGNHIQLRVRHRGRHQPCVERRRHGIVAPMHDERAVRNAVQPEP